jgi:superfamily II DNA or RNA helicase
MWFSLSPQYQLEDWQRRAVGAWLRSRDPELGPRHGILDIYTGAGKTVIALGAMAAVSAEDPGMKYAIVAPTRHLAYQWVDAVSERTTLPATRVGLVGGEGKPNFETHDVLVFVLATARKLIADRSLLAWFTGGQRVMLVADECHKMGAPASSRIFDAQTVCRLGLSATPYRTGSDAHDELGQEIPLRRQRHGRGLGDVCFRFSLRDGYRAGMLPRYQIHHHAVTLTESERGTYDRMSRTVSDAREAVLRCGGRPDSYLAYISRSGVGAALRGAALALQQAYLIRKNFLYKAAERVRVTERLLVEAWSGRSHPAPRGALIFNERIDMEAPEGDEEDDDQEGGERSYGAIALHGRVQQLADRGALPFHRSQVVIEHSRLPPEARRAALRKLKTGAASVLVSVKALQEGIDVPDVGMGVSVASTSSARQRIQTMGRILRPLRDASGRRVPPELAPVKQLHLIYVRDTVDEEIYRRTDWNDETGEDRNQWWRWELAADQPALGSALIPQELSEREAWERIQHLPMPQPWLGPANGLPMVYKHGQVFVAARPDPLPAQRCEEAIALLEAGRQRGSIKDARGRFSLSRRLDVVLKMGRDPTDPSSRIWLAFGRLGSRPTWQGQPLPPTQLPVALPPPSRKPSRQLVDAIDEEVRVSDQEWWYVLVQEGFLAATRGDQHTLLAITELLRRRKRDWAYRAVETLAHGTRNWGDGYPAQTTNDQIVPFVAQAYADGRPDLVRWAHGRYEVGWEQKPRRVAIENALAILAGQSRKVYRPYERSL